MIKKTYTLTYKISPFKSKLKSVKNPSCADLYLNKLQGNWTSKKKKIMFKINLKI